MPLRILHALYTVDPGEGGAMENVRLLSAVCRYLKHRIEVLAFACGDAAWRRQFPGVVHEVGAGCARGEATQRFMLWLREHARDYDCVLVGGAEGRNAYRAWRVLRETGVPYFVFAPRYLGFSKGVPREWAKTKQRLFWPLAGYPLFRDAHAVFFSSEEAKREVRGCFWPYDCHEFVLTCGVADVLPGHNTQGGAGFPAAHPEWAGKRVFSVLAPGADLIPDALLRAVRTLAEAGLWNRDSMRLVLAGFDDAGAADALRRAVERHGLGGIVHGVGTPGASERRSLLQASKALVQPAQAENSGRAVAEALAAGKPVLIARGLNLWREVLGHSVGLAAEDSEAGYTALFNGWLRESPAGRAAFGANARRCYETHYTEQAAANTLTAVIYLLIGATQAGGQSVAPDIFRHEMDFL